jgi:hypothetical protein
MAHLLFGLVSSARPFGDNVFLGLGVCRKREGDTRECSALNDQSILFRRDLARLTKSMPTIS